MTGLAGQALVFAFKFIFGLCIVIEYPQGPVIRVVAILAGLTHGSLMNIVFAVAGHAFEHRILIGGRQVAFFTGSRGMQTDQRKAGQIMVKNHFFPPAAFIVATGAVLTLLPGMDIVETVTGITFHFQFFFEDFSLMAGAANQLFMFTA